jgi:hypothetical protein
VASTAAASSDYDFSPGPRIVQRPSRVRRARRAFTRYLFAICIGVAATLAWQAYGDVVKQTVAAKAPEFGWSPEIQQLIAATLQQVGWTKSADLESGATPTAASATQQPPFAQASFDPAGPKPSAGPSPTLEQVQQIASDLTVLKQAITQLSSNQDQMAQGISRVQAMDQEVLDKVSANRLVGSNAASNPVNNKVAASKVPASPPQAAAMPAHKRPPASPTPSAPPQPLPLH